MREIGNFRFEHNGDCFWNGEEATHWHVYKKIEGESSYLHDGAMMTARGLSDDELLNEWMQRDYNC
jgi:hypothetical protein